MLVHLDTDFAGDPDDACALAMLLGWPDVELAGITTVLEQSGRRAGCVRHVLELAGRPEVPVAAGAETTLTGGRYECTWGDPRHWPAEVAPAGRAPGAAVDLLARNMADGATVIAIGGFTNLAMLELSRPGALHGVAVVATAGWFAPPAPGLPQWGPELDFNTQVDVIAAEIVARTATLTLVPMPLAMEVWLRRRDLPQLRASGPMGELLAAQSEAHSLTSGFGDLARRHAGLPDDLVNFHWDPVTCAVALGWAGARASSRLLRTEVADGALRFVEDPSGRPHRVADGVDGEAFAPMWLEAVARVGALG